jgi:uncharacterized protein YebE (UPF0316 family)
LDWLVLGALALASVLYVVLLQVWMRWYPESYRDNTWVMVFFGVVYVVVGLGFVLDWEAWLRVCAAFVAAGLPIIARSLVNAARRRHRANHYGEEG